MTSMSDLSRVLIETLSDKLYSKGEKLILYIGAWIDAFMRPKKHWLRMKFLFAVLEEWIFENLRGPFHDELIRFKFLNDSLNKM